MSSETFAPAPTPAPGALEWFYGVLFRPASTFATWPLERASGPAALAVLLVAAIGGLTAAGAGIGAVMLGFATWLGWLVLGWFVSTALLFVIARIMSRQGEFLTLLAATGLAYLPMVLTGPLAAMAGWGRFGMAMSALGHLLVFIWYFRLLLASVKGVMGLSTGQAVLTMVVAELTVAAIPWLFITLGFMSIALALS